SMIDGEGKRKALASSAGGVEDFLRSLEMRAYVAPIGPANITRVVQLLAKTNQFNVTTRRHTQAEVEALVAAGVGVTVRVVDRFGDSGLVGVAIAVPA